MNRYRKIWMIKKSYFTNRNVDTLDLFTIIFKGNLAPMHLGELTDLAFKNKCIFARGLLFKASFTLAIPDTQVSSRQIIELSNFRSTVTSTAPELLTYDFLGWLTIFKSRVQRDFGRRKTRSWIWGQDSSTFMTWALVVLFIRKWRRDSLSLRSWIYKLWIFKDNGMEKFDMKYWDVWKGTSPLEELSAS